jgi:hypothetical protein
MYKKTDWWIIVIKDCFCDSLSNAGSAFIGGDSGVIQCPGNPILIGFLIKQSNSLIPSWACDRIFLIRLDIYFKMQ